MKAFLANVLFLMLSLNLVLAQSFNIPTPENSEKFGSQVVVLSNGNYIVTDPYFDDGALINVGAVYVYKGIDHSLISILKGSNPNDEIGNNGITLLNNGNFLISSTKWNSGHGALTWASALTGISGVVDEHNSLVGTQSNSNPTLNILVFNNGNYVVSDFSWNNFRGAVTWGDGQSGVTGVISSLNSFIGTNELDKVGQTITKLNNGNYIISSSTWNNNRGAVTLASSAIGIIGVVNEENSLIGTQEGDAVSSNGITVLPNNNYLVGSQFWNKRGAVTFCEGEGGLVGQISNENSLVGSFENDAVGLYSTQILTNGNYIVRVPYWNSFRGAVVWGSGNIGITGEVGLKNALIGNEVNKRLGAEAITLLSNGNYVVKCPTCNAGNPTITWGDGVNGITGEISIDNSFWPINNDSSLSSFVTALTNGNYVITSPSWNNNRGAVTWADGTKGISGLVTSANSIIGEREGDNLGGGGVFLTLTGLTNGNYVFGSETWNNGAGAVTWADGTTGITGFIDDTNSLLGSSTKPLGVGLITALTNGNYVVCFQHWNQGLGAATWGDGTKPITGQISKETSLVGTPEYNAIGQHGVRALLNGNYVVNSYESNVNRGAVTWGNGFSGTVGTVSSQNSLVGSNWNDYVGRYFVNSMPDGNYHVLSPSWNNSTGAFTFGNGVTGTSGVLSKEEYPDIRLGGGSYWLNSNGNYLVQGYNLNGNSTSLTWANANSIPTQIVNINNSFISRDANENLGKSYNGDVNFKFLSNGNYLILSSNKVQKTETVTFANSSVKILGTISDCNSITGTAVEGGPNLSYQYNDLFKYLIVGSPNDNRVTIFKPVNIPIPDSTEEFSTEINGSNDIDLISSENCTIIAKVKPNGDNPVSGTINTKIWIEPTVPTHNGNPFVARHYEITPIKNSSNATSRLTLFFSQQEFDAFNSHSGSLLDLPANATDLSGKNNLRISKYSGTSSNGSGLPESYSGNELVIDPVDEDIIWNSFSNRWEVSFNTTGFSGFTITTATVALPLTLIEFKGHSTEKSVTLSWKTTNENNTSKFIIERSLDAKHFETNAVIQANNRQGIQNYGSIDHNAPSLKTAKVYYRIKLIDQDETFAYSRMIAVTLPQNETTSVYPNPTTDNAEISVDVDKPEAILLNLVDVKGALIKQYEHSLVPGNNRINVDLKGIHAGIYIIEIKGETVLKRNKLIIK